MIIKRGKNQEQVELKFGNGDVAIAGGSYIDDYNNKMGVMTFSNQDAREIGSKSKITAGIEHDINMFPVIMTFTDIKSIDVIIAQLEQTKKEMMPIKYWERPIITGFSFKEATQYLSYKKGYITRPDWLGIHFITKQGDYCILTKSAEIIIKPENIYDMDKNDWMVVNITTDAKQILTKYNLI